MAISNLSWQPLSFHANTPSNIAAATASPRSLNFTIITGVLLKNVKLEEVSCEFSATMIRAGIKVRCPKSGVLELDLASVKSIEPNTP